MLFGFASSLVFALLGMLVKAAQTAQLASFVLILPPARWSPRQVRQY
jgi:hypothetical protein